MTRPDAAPQALKLFNIFAPLLLLCFLAFGLLGFDLVQENGLIENAQVAVMILSAVIFVAQVAALLKMGFAQADKATLTYCLFALCMPLIGSGRELSFGRVLGAPPGLVTGLKYGMGVVILTLLITCLILWIRHVRHRTKKMLGLLMSPSSLSIYVGLVLFGLATVAEKAHIGPANGMFLEEVFELAAFLMIVRAALLIKPMPVEIAPGPAQASS